MAEGTERPVTGYEELLAKLEAIERRLFKDNGTLSIQSRLQRHEQILRAMVWAMAVVGGTLLSAAVMALIFLLKWALVHGGTP